MNIGDDPGTISLRGVLSGIAFSLLVYGVVVLIFLW